MNTQLALSHVLLVYETAFIISSRTPQSLFSHLNIATEHFKNSKFYELTPLSPSTHISFKDFRRNSFSESLSPNIFLLITDRHVTKLKKYYEWYDFYTSSQLKSLHFSYYTGKTRQTVQQTITHLLFILKNRDGMLAFEHRIQEVCLTFSWLLLKRQGKCKLSWRLAFKSSNLIPSCLKD